MIIRMLAFITLQILFSSILPMELTDSPQVLIVNWVPGIVASGDILARNSDLRRQQERMPIWVTISFNKEVSNDFIKKFFNNLNRLAHTSKTPTRHSQNRNHFVVTIDRSIKQEEFQSILRQASYLCIDPAIIKEREAQLAREKIETERKEIALAEAKNQQLLIAKQAETDRKAKEAAEIEKIKKETQTTLKPNVLQDMLHKAMLNNSETEIRDAIEKGANVNLGIGNQPPIGLAVMLRKHKAVQALLKCGATADIEYQGQPIVLYALAHGQIESAFALVKHGAPFDGKINGIDSFTFLSTKIDSGFNPSIFDLMHEMIKRGYNIQANFNSPNLSNNSWYLAIHQGNENLVSFFLNRSKNYTLSNSANPNQIFVFSDGSTWTPTLIALKQKSSAILRTLGSVNANMNQQAMPDGKNLWTPLSYLLTLEQSPDPYNNRTLDYEIDSLIKDGANLANAIENFLKNGGDPEYTIKLRPAQGNQHMESTLLGLAVAKNDLKTVKTLVSAGANINRLTSHFIGTKLENATPLFHALQNGFGDIIEFLLHHKAQI